MESRATLCWPVASLQQVVLVQIYLMAGLLALLLLWDTALQFRPSASATNSTR